MRSKEKSEKIRKLIVILPAIIIFPVVLIWAILTANGTVINLSNLFNTTVEPTEEPPTIFSQTGTVEIVNKEYEDKITAFLDGEEIEVVENRIQGIDIGQYELILKLEGYNDWKSTIQVESGGIVTHVYPQLFPEGELLPEPAITPTHIDKIFFSKYTNFGDYAYYVVTNSPVGRQNGIYKLRLSDQSTAFTIVENEPIKIVNIVDPIADILYSGNYEILPSPDNSKIILKAEGTPYYILDAENPNSNNIDSDEFLSIEGLLGYLPEEFEWFKGSSSLIVKDKNFLGELVLSNQKLVTIFYNPEKNPIYGVNGNTVIFLSATDNSIMHYTDETSKPIKLENIVLPEKLDDILIDKDTANHIIFRSGITSYYLNIADSFVNEIGENIAPLSLAKNGSGLIYKKDENIYTYLIERIEAIETYETSNNLIIENFDENSQTIQWNTSSSHMILRETRLDELDETPITTSISIMDRNGENKFELINSDIIRSTQTYMPFDNKEFFLLMEYSLNPAQNSLFKIKLEKES